MSPASRSKSKDKRAANKEPPKNSSNKPIANANGGGSTIPTSGYNPILGTFHTLETAPVSASSPLLANNGRFRNIDDTEDHVGNSVGFAVESDSVSNNGSWSGESEDHKEKAPPQTPLRQDISVPGGAADNDKREKNRQKNERKHQRQKERRAQELHERCNGYLMSRKLESLAQQLVAMGFSSERATMALILNEGRVEESVAWLFEGGEESNNNHKEHNLDGGGHLKIDISEELACILQMEIKFNCTKQEVERAVVACEGDLEQAADNLRAQKQEAPTIQPKPEEIGDPLILGDSVHKTSVAISQNLRVSQSKPSAVAEASQYKRDERDSNYTKDAAAAVEPGSRNMQLLKKFQPKLEWAKQQQQPNGAADTRWPVAAANPSISYSFVSSSSASSSSSLQAPPTPAKAQYMSVGNDCKNLHLGSVREPVVVMQRPQSKQLPAAASLNLSLSLSSPPVSDWHPTGVVEPITVKKPNGSAQNFVPGGLRSFSSIPSYSGDTVSNYHFYDQLHYQPQQQNYIPVSGSHVDFSSSQLGTNRGSSPTLSAASSLGLFAGLGSNGASSPSSPVDWNTDRPILLQHLDYASIDWSLDRAPPLNTRLGGMWGGSSMQSSSDSCGVGRSGMASRRPLLSNGANSVFPTGGMQNGVAAGASGGGDGGGAETSASASSREWSSPFEERDIFSLPRQFVSSPSR